MYDNKITDFLKENYKISEDVIKMAETAENDLKEMFAEADRITEYNQYKVLNAMQKNKLSDVHFAGTTGYGYNDLGRDVLEQIYADRSCKAAGNIGNTCAYCCSGRKFKTGRRNIFTCGTSL